MKLPHLKIRFRTKAPDITSFDDSKDHDWAGIAYHEDPKHISEDAPEQLGKESALTHYFDLNLMHNVTDVKAVTGCPHLLNKTPIYSHGKKQGSAETAAF